VAPVRRPELSRLAAEVDAANQTIAGAVASYRQAQALVRESARVVLPASLVASARRSGGGRLSGHERDVGSRTGNAFSSRSTATGRPTSGAASVAPVEGARASEQASARRPRRGTLSAQGALAIDYFALREADFEVELLRRTIEGYERALEITQNRYAAGVVARTDVLQARRSWRRRARR
jgi:outer membrane protein TolC